MMLTVPEFEFLGVKIYTSLGLIFLDCIVKSKLTRHGDIYL